MFPVRSALVPLCSALLALVLLIPLVLAPAQARAAAESQITEYRVVRSLVRDTAGRQRLAIRSFRCDGIPHLLVVDPLSFATFDLPASELSTEVPAAENALAATPFGRALKSSTAAPFPLQNDGATRAEAPLGGVCLTVDLCPSKRSFERELFDTLVDGAAPVPVAVAVTGAWLLSHPEELAYLKRESAAGKLVITWMNHSLHHPYDPQAPLARTFLLTPGTDFDAEVLEVEKLLLARGLVPSPFFRFPGLVSDAATVKRLRELSLIPIGADAWLAKGEHPKKGSFILVHGNGNEPKGIKLILPMLRRGELNLMPLSAAFGG
ncbi:hypothetical protein GMST_39590 [Geomonas silvestris]|uniref:Polysaccharide deacetylase n=1 Tax=Geomonas silvestris TaxID=2740184 RepID=A0A6V8MNW2_9BACT|nr:polysaccharide deacetylase [Geomonas silvestris]GFO61634.1 hypothetical protein GMST_39590 [Geomonas silvestris]